MSLDKLRCVLPTPSEPIDVGTEEDWLVVEQEVGFAFPDDFKEYTKVYGRGEIGEYLTVLNPFTPNTIYNLLADAPYILDMHRELASEFEEDNICPFPLYPEPDGLFPWAKTRGNEYLFWLTAGPPDMWPVVVSALGFDEQLRRFEMGMTDFLWAWIGGTLNYRGFPANLECLNTFTVYRDGAS
jgi:hypothetical protein